MKTRRVLLTGKIRICIDIILFVTMMYFMNKGIHTGQDVFKGMASCCFVIVGILNQPKAGSGKDIYARIMLAALIAGLVGDVVIEINFLAGAFAFLIGHLLYVWAYLTILPFSMKDLICAGIVWLISVSILIFIMIKNFRGMNMMIMCMLYVAVLSLMAGKSLGNYLRRKNLFTILVCIGSFVFLISDIFVALYAFRIIPLAPTSVFSQGIYFASQYLLAQSISLERE